MFRLPERTGSPSSGTLSVVVFFVFLVVTNVLAVVVVSGLLMPSVLVKVPSRLYTSVHDTLTELVKDRVICSRSEMNAVGRS